ncbi:hypothetical protein H6G33_36395 [Calothrix sp. FACHB-1219]|uniref:hypothetical protein n=1 Tax=unclassified Calothrix TaxID=2619626 RepID=UPI001682F259|nr:MULTISPECIES: hypothetical protein [unclassified Calothrix]MBD2207793.1 hypothetical protein [Calothrix sp. FACHB-168]MBD2222413.1 hypothetical protein [Calothrix sp. FACHB-1219]
MGKYSSTILCALTFSIFSYQLSATAAELKFNGGTYRIVQTAGGFYLENFLNLTKENVNDLHVSFTYLDTNKDVRNITENYAFEDVAPKGTYTPPTVPDSDFTIVFPRKFLPTQDDQTFADAGTYWTKCGNKILGSSKESVIASMIASFSNALIPPASAETGCPVPSVPEPSSVPTTMMFSAVLGASIFLNRKKLKTANLKTFIK